MAEPAGRLLSPLSYYGSKARLAPWIVSLLPAHRVYVEPFFGSGAVLFAKRPATHEIVNDLDDAVVCFFRVLRDHPVELERACWLTPYVRAEFEAARLDEPGLGELEVARRFWVRSAGAFNKCVNQRRSWASSARRGSNEAVSAMRLVDRMHACAERLRRVSIECRPAVEVIGRYGTNDAVIYCDPPYLAGVRRALDRHRQSDYRVDYSTEAEHRQLAAVLHASPATVLLSGYPSELYAELYAGWWRAERLVARPSTNVTGGSGGPATECIWSNRPLAGQLPCSTWEVPDDPARPAPTRPWRPARRPREAGLRPSRPGPRRARVPGGPDAHRPARWGLHLRRPGLFGSGQAPPAARLEAPRRRRPGDGGGVVAALAHRQPGPGDRAAL